MAKKREPTQKFRLVACRVWKVMRMRGYTDEKKLLWLYLLTGDGTNYTGIFDFWYSQCAEDMSWLTRKGQPDSRRVSRLMSEFIQEGRVSYDPKAGVLLMLNWLEYKPIASKDTAAGVAIYLKSLPNTPLIADWFAQARLYLSEEIVHALTVAYEGGGLPPKGPGEGSPDRGGVLSGDKEVRSKDKDKKYGEGTGVPPQKGPQPGRPQNAGSGTNGGSRSDVPEPSSLPPVILNAEPGEGPIIRDNLSHQRLVRLADSFNIDMKEIKTIEQLRFALVLTFGANRIGR